MDPIKIQVAEFGISTPFKCRTEVYTVYNEDRTEELRQVIHTYTEPPSTATITKDFAFELPEGASIKSAKIYATIGPTTYGAEKLTINGVGVSANSTVAIAVTVGSGATSVSVPFTFLSKTVQHDHFSDGSGYYTNDGGWYDDTLLSVVKYDHAGTVRFSNVYLLIEYDGGSGSGYVYRAESGELVPYRLCRAESGELVPYQLCRAEGGELVPY